MIDGATDRADRLCLVGSAPHPPADRPGSKGDARWIEVRSRDGDRFEYLGHICSLMSGGKAIGCKRELNHAPVPTTKLGQCFPSMSTLRPGMSSSTVAENAAQRLSTSWWPDQQHPFGDSGPETPTTSGRALGAAPSQR